MKKRYKMVLILCVIECLCISILSEYNIKIDSVIGNILGTVLFIAPIIVLFHMLGKDNEKSSQLRIVSKMLNIFLIVCFIAGCIVEILGLGN